MRHIKKDSIVSRSASSENANFPISRTADMHPKRKYRALTGVWSAVITLGVVGGCSDVMLAGTNAASASVAVTDPNEMSWADSDTWGGGDSWANPGVSVTATVTQRNRTNALWLQLSETVAVPCEVALLATCSPTETLEIGVIRAAIAETYGGRNPQYGLSEGGEDKSIFAENSNGSFYLNQRDKLRRFGVSATMLREDAWLLADHYDVKGMEPSAWKITDGADSEWIAFARMTGRPQISHSYQRHDEISFELIEVV